MQARAGRPTNLERDATLAESTLATARLSGQRDMLVGALDELLLVCGKVDQLVSTTAPVHVARRWDSAVRRARKALGVAR